MNAFARPEQPSIVALKGPEVVIHLFFMKAKMLELGKLLYENATRLPYPWTDQLQSNQLRERLAEVEHDLCELLCHSESIALKSIFCFHDPKSLNRYIVKIIAVVAHSDLTNAYQFATCATVANAAGSENMAAILECRRLIFRLCLQRTLIYQQKDAFGLLHLGEPVLRYFQGGNDVDSIVVSMETLKKAGLTPDPANQHPVQPSASIRETGFVKIPGLCLTQIRDLMPHFKKLHFAAHQCLRKNNFPHAAKLIVNFPGIPKWAGGVALVGHLLANCRADQAVQVSRLADEFVCTEIPSVTRTWLLHHEREMYLRFNHLDGLLINRRKWELAAKRGWLPANEPTTEQQDDEPLDEPPMDELPF